MKPAHSVLALMTLLLLAAVTAAAVLNWPALATETTWHLGFADVQWPLGAAVLLLAAVLCAPLAAAYLGHVIGTMIDTRRLLQDLQRLQKLADQAEASRIDGLRDLIGREFNRLHARLDIMPTDGPGTGHGEPSDAVILREDAAAAAPATGTRANALGRWFGAGS